MAKTRDGDAEFVRLDNHEFTSMGDSERDFRKTKLTPPMTERVCLGEWARMTEQEREVDEAIIERRIAAKIGERK